MSNKKYFLDLNYSLANEDTNLERSLTKQLKPRHIVSVCGSGSRSFPLLNQHVKKISLVDLSEQQLFLAQLRAATIRQLSYTDFLLFWGYAPFSVKENTSFRKELFYSFDLDQNCQKYFIYLFEKHNWESILYLGKWESTFIFFSKIVRKVIGQKNIEKLFSFTNLDSQKKYIKKGFPANRWKLIMSILGNKAMFNALLYKGDFIRKNVPETYLDYYSKAFYHLMTYDLTRSSFFLQLCFLGEIKFADGNLIEANRECFDDMKASLERVEVEYIKKDILSAVADMKDVDFLSISDVPSYFSGEIEKRFFQKIRPSLSKKGVVVNRNYLRVPNADRSSYKDITKNYQSELALEKVQMYRVEILENESIRQ